MSYPKDELKEKGNDRVTVFFLRSQLSSRIFHSFVGSQEANALSGLLCKTRGKVGSETDRGGSIPPKQPASVS
jgi:hypothetical protein